ncbi:MAG: polysaccharide biosynthesis tyrosine autokinase, partial [Frankiaceae bacterium]|nr:polysaccharide biosynthesis tyrosine autokinase [Frankiaceae bacterium]
MLRVLRKRWWIVLLAVAIGGSSALVWTAQSAPIYQARIIFFVSMPSSTDAAALAADQFASRRVNSYVRLLSSDATARAIQAAGIDLPTGAIAGEISGSADLNTVLLTAVVRDGSKSRALAIAAAIGDRFGAVVADNDAQARPSTTDTGVQPIELRVISGPSVGATPVSPRPKLNLMVGLLAGLAIGIAIALSRELSDSTVRTAEQLVALTETAVLGTIPAERGARQAPVIPEAERSGPRAEAMRKIRTNLQFTGIESPIQVLAISSSLPGEGKTSTVLNLGMVVAESDRRVLIIDCDLRSPKIRAYAGLPSVYGLTDLLAERAPLKDVVWRWGDRTLDILPCGTIPPNPSELLGSKAMTELIASLRAHYDLILLDTPPLVPVTDAAVAASYTDGVALMVRYKTSRAAVSHSLRALEAVDARVVGAILAMAPSREMAAAGIADGSGNYGNSGAASTRRSISIRRGAGHSA